jgi:predicted nucleic acid-binding Zn ribbon protein
MFSRHFSSVERADNRKNAAVEFANGTWDANCENYSKMIHAQIESVLSVLSEKYKIDNYNCFEDCYSRDWDLFFWRNDEADKFDYFRLDFNDNRTEEENMKLLSEILKVISEINEPNVSCVVCRKVVPNDDALYDEAVRLYEKNKGRVFDTSIGKARVKMVSENDFGMFGNGWRSHFIPVEYIDYILACRGVERL